jgi:formate-dependent nitrite reductase membrane component NrfD
MKNEIQRKRWGWEIALEMSFIGSGSGAFLCLFFLQVIMGINLLTTSLWIPLILVMIGLGFLFIDLGHPLRAWRSILNLGSTISIGAVIITAFILTIFFLVYLAREKTLLGTFLLNLATLIAVGTALYPGILLAEVRGRNSILTMLSPTLSLVYSLSTGTAWLILEGSLTGIWVESRILPILNLIVIYLALIQFLVLFSWVIVAWRLGEEKWKEVLWVCERRKGLLLLLVISTTLPPFSICTMNQTVLVMAIQSGLIIISGVALRFLLLARDSVVDLKEIISLLRFAVRGNGQAI